MKQETPEQQAAIVELKKLGKAGKLWRVEVIGRIGNEIHHYFQSNRTAQEIQEFREGVYRLGLMIAKDPGHWVVIHPADILEVHLWKQKQFFET